MKHKKLNTALQKQRNISRLLDIEREIKLSFERENMDEEKKAIDNIKKSHKFFYKFAKMVIRSKIGLLRTKSMWSLTYKIWLKFWKTDIQNYGRTHSKKNLIVQIKH